MTASNVVMADLPVTSFVDKLLDCLEAGVSPGNVWLNTTQHVDGRLVDLQGRIQLMKQHRTEQIKGLK